MRHLLLLSAFALLLPLAHGQSIGINADGSTPNASSMLDINVSALPSAGKRGLLIPRMTSAERAAIATPATGLLVYDTNTNSFWYHNSAGWVEMFVGGSVWGLSGNVLTGTEKFGSTNAQPVAFYTNNTERMRLLANGQVAIATSTPAGGDVFTVRAPGNTGASTNIFAISGYVTPASASSGIGVYGRAEAPSSRGVHGRNLHQDGFGVSGSNDHATGTGLVATGNNTVGLKLAAGSGGAYTGTKVGIFSYATEVAGGTGVYGVGNGIGLPTLLTTGAGVAGLGTSIGVYGRATSDAVGGEQLTTRAGGYFESGSGSTFAWTYVAGYGLDGGSAVPRKVLGNGTVNTVVKDTQDRYVLLSAPEAPENLFQDYGTGQLVNGRAHVTLDPTLSKNITVNDKHPLRVFVQLRGDCKGVYVTNETAEGFDVIELQGGASNTPFFWTITANRANQVNADGSEWKFAEERFAPTAGPKTSQPAETERIPAVKDGTDRP